MPAVGQTHPPVLVETAVLTAYTADAIACWLDYLRRQVCLLCGGPLNALAWLGLDFFLTLGVGFGYLRARDEGSQISGGPSAGYKNSPG